MNCFIPMAADVKFDNVMVIGALDPTITFGN
jgi:hypothetical protein